MTVDNDGKRNMGTNIISNNNNKIDDNNGVLGTTPIQRSLFLVEHQVTVEDIELGVLESGIPYLTGRGLERMCGVEHGPFHRLTTNWTEEKQKPRGRKIDQLLKEFGYTDDQLYIKAQFNGKEINAFTEPVCMALLEYYALHAEPKREKALTAYRTLARKKFREFVYEAVGYHPDHKILDSWKHFHDRVDMTMDAVPNGYFCVFREIASMIVPMIRAGIMISDKVVPDISVGKSWSSFWKDNNLVTSYGERIKFDHEYPSYYPQSKSNPQPAFAYPDSALGVFRSWLRQHYITNRFPKYLFDQAKKGKLESTTANMAIEAFSNAKLLE